ncbi:MAG: FISUMP domain-containing protein [bacterium]
MKTKKHQSVTVISILITVSFFLLWGNSYSQETGSFKDKRDGNMYQWVKLGNKVWMAENLKYLVPAGCWAYENDSANATGFGYLYDWTAAQMACPKGWHLPSAGEFEMLIETLGGDSIAGSKLQEMDTLLWRQNDSLSGNRIENFPLLGGTRHNDAAFVGIKIWGGLWSASLDVVGDPINYLFARGNRNITKSSNNQSSGFAVRCIRK